MTIDSTFKNTTEEEKVTIFFCDDEGVIRALYQNILGRFSHFTYRGFPSAEDLLKEIDSQKVDLIISDMFMLEKTGYDLAQELNQTKPQIPIIIVTSAPLDTILVGQANELPNVKKVMSKDFFSPNIIEQIYETLSENYQTISDISLVKKG